MAPHAHRRGRRSVSWTKRRNARAIHRSVRGRARSALAVAPRSPDVDASRGRRSVARSADAAKAVFGDTLVVDHPHAVSRARIWMWRALITELCPKLRPSSNRQANAEVIDRAQHRLGSVPPGELVDLLQT